MFDKVLYTVQGANKAAFTVNSSNNYYAQACSGYSGTTTIPDSGWPTSFAAGERYDVYKAIKCVFMTDSNAPNGGWPELGMVVVPE